MMRIVFMGTPDFAAAPLAALCEGGFDVALAVTRPDRPRDRGKKVQGTPVKETALAYGVPVAQPEALWGNREFLAALGGARADLIVVAAYGKILPKEILDAPPLGCVNIHASILPKYRGAAPIQRAVIDGEAETGVTLMHMCEEMDAGDIITTRRTAIGRKTSAELFRELSALGAAALLDTLPDIEAGRAGRRPQDHSAATYAPMIRKDEGHVDFTAPPERVERLVRGMNSHPGAFAMHGGAVIKLWEAEATGDRSGEPPGTVISATEEGVRVSAGGGVVIFTKLQAPGRKAMKAADFIRGSRIAAGEALY
jgi:methionyl-tRNA formyltransferase